MISIEYEDWKITCSNILNQKNGRKKIYLQWYPFVNITTKDKNEMLSEKFFYTFIKTGLFLYFTETWLVSNNYMMKANGNFRNASLVSPLMYLVALTIGKTISKWYQPKRSFGIIALYAGNFQENRLFYEKDYSVYCKKCKNLSQSYKYYIKSDIKDFYQNINMNKLFDILNDRFVETNISVSQKDLLIYKELLLFLGQGEFPLMENSTVSSYLSTIVYLDSIDVALYNYIQNVELHITSFVIIRYVDDMYIFFNSDISDKELTAVVHHILNKYSTELKTIDLAINREKTSWKPTTELAGDLKKSFYGGYVDEHDFDNLEDIDTDTIIFFLDQIGDYLCACPLNSSQYSEILNNTFSVPQSEYKPDEIFNSLIYNKCAMFCDQKIIKKLKALINQDYSFLKLDPKRLVIMILNTKNGTLIKTMLSKIFFSHKNHYWDIYDTSIALNYLIQRSFDHKDLLKILKVEESRVYAFYENYCKQYFLIAYKLSSDNYIMNIAGIKTIQNDNKLFFIYFLYMIERKKFNFLAAFAYFKSFFDRFSAHIAFAIDNNDGVKGKPNYKKYYKAGSFRNLYKGITNSESIIETAHKIRNSNPMSHSSAELIDSRDTTKDIFDSIDGLTYLLKSKISTFTMEQNQ